MISARHRNGFIAVVAVAMLAGCGTTKIAVPRMKPAEINISTYKTVAVGEISGPGGAELNNVLTQALFESNRFEVVDRQHLNKILQEQGLSTSGFADPEYAAKLGKLMGSTALLFGQVTRRDYKQETTSSQATCYSNNREYACTNYETTGTWAYNVSMKIVDTSTGRIIATKAFAGTDEDSAQDTDRVPTTTWDRDTVFDGLQRNVVADFMKVIAPYSVQVGVTLFTDGDLPELESGVKYAQQGDWRSSIEQFKAACARADASSEMAPKLKARCHYNLGVAYGYSGLDYALADEEIKRAIGIAPEDSFYQEAAKIRGFMTDTERLKQQGVGGSV